MSRISVTESRRRRAATAIDRAAGCLVIVRPDQYVADVLPLDEFGRLAAYFDGFMLPVVSGR